MSLTFNSDCPELYLTIFTEIALTLLAVIDVLVPSDVFALITIGDNFISCIILQHHSIYWAGYNLLISRFRAFAQYTQHDTLVFTQQI
jgi:hypothetical protein